MPTTSGRQAKAKEKERAKAKGSTIRAKANRTEAKSADLAATYTGTKRMFQQTNVHTQITIRSARPSMNSLMMPRKGYRTTQCPSSILAHLHDQARQRPTKYMAATRLHRSSAATATLIRNYTTPDQNAESCQTTHPTPEPKRRLHLPRIPPLMATVP